MSYEHSNPLDDYRCESNASLSSGWYSDDGAAGASTRPTHRTNTTDYSDDIAVEYITDHSDAIVPQDVDSGYRGGQEASFAGPPYPYDNHIDDGPMDMSQPDAFRWMMSDGHSDGHADMRGSLEALPSTTPPHHAPQELTTELDPHAMRNTTEPENTKRGNRMQKRNPVSSRIYPGWNHEPDNSKLGAGTMSREAHTYGSGSHLLQYPVNASTGYDATEMATPHNFPHHYPDHIDERDLFEYQRATECEDTDWEVVDGTCSHGHLEECPFCHSQRFASSWC